MIYRPIKDAKLKTQKLESDAFLSGFLRLGHADEVRRIFNSFFEHLAIQDQPVHNTSIHTYYTIIASEKEIWACMVIPPKPTEREIKTVHTIAVEKIKPEHFRLKVKENNQLSALHARSSDKNPITVQTLNHPEAAYLILSKKFNVESYPLKTLNASGESVFTNYYDIILSNGKMYAALQREEGADIRVDGFEVELFYEGDEEMHPKPEMYTFVASNPKIYPPEFNITDWASKAKHIEKGGIDTGKHDAEFVVSKKVADIDAKETPLLYNIFEQIVFNRKQSHWDDMIIKALKDKKTEEAIEIINILLKKSGVEPLVLPCDPRDTAIKCIFFEALDNQAEEIYELRKILDNVSTSKDLFSETIASMLEVVLAMEDTTVENIKSVIGSIRHYIDVKNKFPKSFKKEE